MSGQVRSRANRHWAAGAYLCRLIQIFTASDHIRVLGGIFSSNLSLDEHVSSVCAACFYWFRQLQQIPQSLGDESAKTFIRAFVTARVDY